MLLLGTLKLLLFKQLDCFHSACLTFSGLSPLPLLSLFLIKLCIYNSLMETFSLTLVIRLTWPFVFLRHWKWSLSLFVSLFKKQPIPLLWHTRLASFSPLLSWPLTSCCLPKTLLKWIISLPDLVIYSQAIANASLISVFAIYSWLCGLFVSSMIMVSLMVGKFFYLSSVFYNTSTLFPQFRISLGKWSTNK